MKVKGMSLKELRELVSDFKKNPDKHTVLESKIVQYVSDKKYTLDFLDRHISKAPVIQETDLTSGGKRLPSKFIIEVIDGEEDQGDEGSKKNASG